VDYVQALAAKLTVAADVRNLVGKTSLEELLMLLPHTELFVGNDGGVLHMAAIAGVPTVSFFGPETPQLYGPVGEVVSVFYTGVPCSPCLNVYNSKESQCRDNLCLRHLSFETVWAQLQPKLDLRFTPVSAPENA